MRLSGSPPMPWLASALLHGVLLTLIWQWVQFGIPQGRATPSPQEATDENSHVLTVQWLTDLPKPLEAPRPAERAHTPAAPAQATPASLLTVPRPAPLRPQAMIAPRNSSAPDTPPQEPARPEATPRPVQTPLSSSSRESETVATTVTNTAPSSATDERAAHPPSAAPTPVAPPVAPPAGFQQAVSFPADHRACSEHSVDSYYPALLRDRGIEGVVVLRVQVDERGRAAEVRVQHGSGWRLLDEAAAQVARACPFIPARRGDQTLVSWVEYPVRFALHTLSQ